MKWFDEIAKQATIKDPIIFVRFYFNLLLVVLALGIIQKIVSYFFRV